MAAGDLGDLVSQAMEKRKRQQEAEAQKAYDERWQERVRQGESRAAAAPKRAAAATGPRVVRPAANFFYLVAFITCSFGIYTLSTGKSLLRGDQGGSHAEIIGGAIGMIIGGLLYALCAFFGRTVGWVYICGIVLYLLDAIVMLFSGNIGGIVIRVLIASWLIRGYAGRPEN